MFLESKLKCEDYDGGLGGDYEEEDIVEHGSSHTVSNIQPWHNDESTIASMVEDLFGTAESQHHNFQGDGHERDEKARDAELPFGDDALHMVATKRKSASLSWSNESHTKWLKNKSGDKAPSSLLQHQHDSNGGAGVLSDTMMLVMEFLAPRELLSVAITCKTLMKNVTTRLVVRNSLIVGGSAREQMGRLYPLMKDQNIYVPSPLRLLRLANARYCEAPGCNNGNRVIRRGWGINLCWNCLNVGGRSDYNPGSKRYALMFYKRDFAKRWGKQIAPAILENKQILKNQHWSVSKSRKYTHFWQKELVSASGEVIGPLFTLDDIDQAALVTVNGKEAVATLLESAPPAAQYKPFVEAYEANLVEADEAERQRQELKAKMTKTKKSKKDAFLEVLKRIRSKIDARWRHRILNYDTPTYPRQSSRFEGQFQVPFVRDLLMPYIRAPSKAKSQRMVTKLAQEINERMSLMYDLFRLGFLVGNDSDEKDLKRRFREKYPMFEFLVTKHFFDPSLSLRANLVRSLYCDDLLDTMEDTWEGGFAEEWEAMDAAATNSFYGLIGSDDSDSEMEVEEEMEVEFDD